MAQIARTETDKATNAAKKASATDNVAELGKRAAKLANAAVDDFSIIP